MIPPQKPKRKVRKNKGDSLEGQLLIAMPSLTDKWFSRSLIYMCAHTSKGAMGLIVNQRAKNISFTDLLSHLEIAVPTGKRALPRDVSKRTVHVGGPVETARGFVLHSSDYADGTTTLVIDNGICLTATVDIVRAMARGKGPAQSLLALGYASWGAGQLESELHSNTWLHVAPDDALLFDEDLGSKHGRAMAKLGIAPGFLVNAAGHA
jgi:putative transcriptional regulator